MNKKIAEIYWDDNMGKGIVKWLPSLNQLECQPTCYLDLQQDLLYEIEKMFNSKELIKLYPQTK